MKLIWKQFHKKYICYQSQNLAQKCSSKTSFNSPRVNGLTQVLCWLDKEREWDRVEIHATGIHLMGWAYVDPVPYHHMVLVGPNELIMLLSLNYCIL